MKALAVAIAALVLAGAPPAARRWPAGVQAPPAPAGNPMNAAKVALGRRLFYDADLSADGTMACATCHEQHRGFADGNPTHPGVHGDAARRNVPGLANVAWARSLTWGDPRIRTLEAQVRVPVLGETPIEMGMKGREAEIARRLAGDPCYRSMFAEAFPMRAGRIDMEAIAAALAAFERTLIALDTPYDRARGGGLALAPAAAHGEAIFRRACAGCHSGRDFSDGRFHRVVPYTAADRGLGEISGRKRDDGRFRTPGLRNVALTAPYLHDGSAASLEQAIRRHRGFATPSELPALLAFLATLTDTGFARDPRFALPSEACGRPL